MYNTSTPFDDFMSDVKEVIKKYIFFATDNQIFENFPIAERLIMYQHYEDISSLLHQVKLVCLIVSMLVKRELAVKEKRRQ